MGGGRKRRRVVSDEELKKDRDDHVPARLLHPSQVSICEICNGTGFLGGGIACFECRGSDSSTLGVTEVAASPASELELRSPAMGMTSPTLKDIMKLLDRIDAMLELPVPLDRCEIKPDSDQKSVKLYKCLMNALREAECVAAQHDIEAKNRILRDAYRQAIDLSRCQPWGSHTLLTKNKI